MAEAVLAHPALAVALVILHIEWMTQRHYVESIKDDHDLDPQFKSLLRHHWMEEAQHTKLDTLMIEDIAAAASPEDIEQAVDHYIQIGGLLDTGLGKQVELDLASFRRVDRPKPDGCGARTVHVGTAASDALDFPGLRDDSPELPGDPGIPPSRSTDCKLKAWLEPSASCRSHSDLRVPPGI